MKLFTCNRIGNYSGGVICVAAFSIGNAQACAIQELDKNDKSYIAENISDYYPLSNWKEVKDVKVNCDKPMLICEGGYTE